MTFLFQQRLDAAWGVVKRIGVWMGVWTGWTVIPSILCLCLAEHEDSLYLV